jgi:hypothetical protein
VRVSGDTLTTLAFCSVFNKLGAAFSFIKQLVRKAPARLLGRTGLLGLVAFYARHAPSGGLREVETLSGVLYSSGRRSALVKSSTLRLSKRHARWSTPLMSAIAGTRAG